MKQDIKWHETCKCKCRLDASVCNNKQRWNNDQCRCECKELIDKCRKRLVDKLIEECNENIEEEIKILDKSKDKCSSCILYIIIFNIFYNQYWNCYLFYLLQIHKS